MAHTHDRQLNPLMRRREFVRASAVSIGAVAASATLSPLAPVSANAAASPRPRYVGAGNTARVRPFTLDKVALGDGLFSEKRARMLDFARQYDERRFLVLFNNTAGRPNPPGVQVPGGWEDGGLLSGHWTGHFMTMLAQAHVSTGEPVFTDKLCVDGRRARGVPGRAGRQDGPSRLPGREARGRRAQSRPAALRGLRRQSGHQHLGALVHAAQDHARLPRRLLRSPATSGRSRSSSRWRTGRTWR